MKATKHLFSDNGLAATVGVEIMKFNLKIDGKVVNLEIWDTCGLETFRSLITNYYKNSSLAIIVYAINE